MTLSSEITDRAAQQRFGPLRRQAIRGGEIVDSKLMVAFALMKHAAVVEGLGVVRVERDRMIELGERLFGFSGPCQRLAARRGGLRFAHLGSARSRLSSRLLVRR